VTILGREAEVDALVTDAYLEALLAGRGPDARPRPRGRREAVDAAVRLASERLTRDLPRFHPSFRFEERLAVRLAEAAAALRMPAAAGAEGIVVPLRQPGGEPFDPLADPDGDDGLESGLPRPLIIGGAMASALSLAGAAWVAWRRTRTSTSPMARAARAAHLRAAGARRPV
jgi:hypothetical protein